MDAHQRRSHSLHGPWRTHVHRSLGIVGSLFLFGVVGPSGMLAHTNVPGEAPSIYDNQRQLGYDFIVAPGADLNQIQLVEVYLNKTHQTGKVGTWEQL